MRKITSLVVDPEPATSRMSPRLGLVIPRGRCADTRLAEPRVQLSVQGNGSNLDRSRPERDPAPERLEKRK